MKLSLPPALQSLEIRKLLLAQIPADFADWLDFVAIASLLAFTWQVAPHVYALQAAGMALPYLLIGPFAGVFVDRFPFRTVWLLSNLGRGLATLALFFAPSWQVLILLVTLRSAVDTFFTPAKQTAIQSLTNDENRTSAVGLSQSINESSKVISPAIGGALLILFSPSYLFLINSLLSFSAAAMALRFSLETQSTKSDVAQETSIFHDAMEGLAEVRGNKTILLTIVIIGAAFFASFLYDPYLAPYLRELSFEQFHLGLSFAAVGLGGLVGSIFISFIKSLKKPFLWSAAGLALNGVMVGSFGWFGVSPPPSGIIPLLGILGLFGLSSSIAFIPMFVELQNVVPEEKMGRVSAINEAFTTTAILSGPFVGALLVSIGSPAVPFVAGGIMAICLAALLIRVNRRHAKSLAASANDSFPPRFEGRLQGSERSL